MTQKPTVIIIGAGPAGLMAADRAACMGCAVLLLERNEKPGKKLYLTGKGRCNVTNDCHADEFLTQVPRNPRFLQSAIRQFAPRDLMTLLEETGVPLVVERGRRVFPKSQKASDITGALVRLCKRHEVDFRYHSRVAAILMQQEHLTHQEHVADGQQDNGKTPKAGPKTLTPQNRVSGVRLEDGQVLEADAVILATGGMSYPGTGSTGDGYALAEALGHTIVPPRPSLVPLLTRETWPGTLAGLALKNVMLRAVVSNKTVYESLGEMLFTHWGVSGPLVLEASAHLPDVPSSAMLFIDMKPGLTTDMLDARLVREFQANARRQIGHALATLMPRSMIEVVGSCAELPADLFCHQVTRKQRDRLAHVLQNLPLTVDGYGAMAEAIITRGGVAVSEVAPSTMASKLVPGLYFAGEVLDVDAHTGGYNLQIAFATGVLAGTKCATACLQREPKVDGCVK